MNLKEALHRERLKYRGKVATLLADNPAITFTEVVRQTGASLRTVSRIARSLGITRRPGRPRKQISTSE